MEPGGSIVRKATPVSSRSGIEADAAAARASLSTVSGNAPGTSCSARIASNRSLSCRDSATLTWDTGWTSLTVRVGMAANLPTRRRSGWLSLLQTLVLRDGSGHLGWPAC